MNREIKLCDQCGKTMTVFDSDNEPIHNGLELKGEIAIDYTTRTHCGVSSGRILTIGKADLCSISCLAKRLDQLVTYVKQED